MSITPLEIVNLYRIWTSIIYRCTKENNKQYKNYGGRGITICEEWKDFNKFCEDIGRRPFKGCHLDRIDNDLGYFKENCRWVTPKVNHRNKRNNKYYETHLGKMCQSELIEKMKYTRKQFQIAIQKYGKEKLLEMFKNGNHPQKKESANLNDIVGKKIRNFTVKSLDPDKSTGVRYFCLCDCGKNTRISRFKLFHETRTTCISCGKIGKLNPKNKKGVQNCSTPPFNRTESYPPNLFPSSLILA